MSREKDEQFPESEHEDVLREDLLDETFHIGQCYEGVAATTLRCLKCGSKEFNVGQGSFFTVLRCPNCKWECCVHSG